MSGRQSFHWLVVMAVLLMACCGLPSASSSHCDDERQWLEGQLKRAMVFKLRAASLEHRTLEQLRELQQLQRRLVADLQAVESIAKQVDCIEAELKASKCHPTQCSALEGQLYKAIEQQRALIACTLKAIEQAEAAIQQAECEAKEQLKRIEAVECDIAALIKLIECALAAEAVAAEKHVPVSPQVEAEWREEIVRLSHKIEAELDAIARDYAALDKSIEHIRSLLHDIELQLRGLRCGLDAILELLQRYHTCLEDAKELRWLEWQLKRAMVFKLRAASLEHRTLEQLRELQQLQCRLVADLQAVESIAKQVDCIEAELKASKCHPTQCSALEGQLYKAIEQQRALIACTLKAIEQAEAAIQQAECEAKEQLKRIEAVECDIAALIKLIECALAAEAVAAEKHVPVSPQVEAEWREEIVRLSHKIEAELDAIARDYAALDKSIEHIRSLLHDIELQLRGLRCGLDAILELLQRYHTCLEDAKELRWLEWQLKRAMVFKLRAASLEHRTLEQLRELQQLQCRLVADLQAVESIAKQVDCIEAELKASKCHPTQCSALEGQLYKAIEQQRALIACTLKAIEQAEAAIQQAECEAKEQLKRIEAVECDIAALIKLIECALAAEAVAAEKHVPVSPQVEAEWREEIVRLSHKIEAELDAIARQADCIERSISAICKLLCSIDGQIRELLAGLGGLKSALHELECCWKRCV